LRELELKGHFWLPNKPEARLQGTLSFTYSEGITLELTGAFEGTEGQGPFRTDIILGRSFAGKNITLYECLLAETSASGSQAIETKFHASVLFAGAHFPKRDDIKFRRASVRYKHLDAWVNVSGFHTEPLAAESGLSNVRVEYRSPASVVARMGDKTISIVHELASSFSLYPRKEVKLRQKAYVMMEFAEETTFGIVESHIYRIQEFLSLALAQPTHAVTVHGITDKSIMTLPGGQITHEPVQIVWHQLDIKRRLGPLTLFTLGEIRDEFDTFLTNWFERAELLEPVYDLYFASLNDSGVYMEHTFLSLVQAAEAYHRRRVGNEELPRPEHELRQSEILASVPEKHRQWLANKLEYSNEPTLRKRLRELLDRLAESNVLNIERDFIDDVVNTRNYLTHYEEKSKDKCARGEQLFRLIQKLKLILHALLLEEVGFDANRTAIMIRRSPIYEVAFRK
jgi:hypothetical protein